MSRSQGGTFNFTTYRPFSVKAIYELLCGDWASLVAQLVKNLPAMQETPVRFLGQEDPLEKGSATHSSILGLPWWHRWQRIHLQCGRPGFDPWVGKIPWRRAWQPTPVFLPGESPLDRGVWRATVHAVAKSQIWLSD